MLVMSVNSKRQRRPNVRLGEIGDISAAWACGFSHNTKEKLGHKTWEKVADDEHNSLYGCYQPLSSEFKASGFCVSAQEFQQNRENNNPNSSELVLEPATSAELTDMTRSKLNFNNVTRKCRDMKRRGRSRNDGYAVLGGSWSSKHSPDDFSSDEKECEETDNAGCTSNLLDGYFSANGFNDFQDHQTPPTSEYDIDQNQPSAPQEGKSNDDAEFDSEETHPESGDMWEEMRVKNNNMNAVSRWLEKVGFGKYAGVFEMHEVDEEALPLLTMEDLKEMGIFSVGPRRKLYNVIQQLREEERAVR